MHTTKLYNLRFTGEENISTYNSEVSLAYSEIDIF